MRPRPNETASPAVRPHEQLQIWGDRAPMPIELGGQASGSQPGDVVIGPIAGRGGRGVSRQSVSIGNGRGAISTGRSKIKTTGTRSGSKASDSHLLFGFRRESPNGGRKEVLVGQSAATVLIVLIVVIALVWLTLNRPDVVTADLLSKLVEALGRMHLH